MMIIFTNWVSRLEGRYVTGYKSAPIHETNTGVKNTFYRLIIWICLIPILALVIIISGHIIIFRERIGVVTGSWEDMRGDVKVKIVRNDVISYYLPTGAYYSLYAKAKASNKWIKVIRTKYDEADYNPNKQIIFINDKIVYVYYLWIYAVSTDGGNSWNVWEAHKNAPVWKYGPSIREVVMNEDGNGKMLIVTDKEYAFSTNNYGMSWIIGNAY